MVYAFSLEPPAQWQAGTVGADRRPFHFDCAQCGAKEPAIAGVLSQRPDQSHLGDIVLLRRGDDPFVKTAMFCGSCWPRYAAIGQCQRVELS